METINKLCDTVIKVCITLGVLAIANGVGAFNPIKRKIKEWKEEADRCQD